MKLAKRYLFLIFLGILLFGSYLYFRSVHMNYMTILSFDDCIKAGFPSLKTYPETCRIPGKLFTNESQKQSDYTPPTSSSTETLASSYKNLSYFVDGQKLKMTEGIGIFAASTSKQITFRATDAISFFKKATNTEYGFFLAIREDTPTKQQSYYLGSATSLYFSFTGLNFLFLDTSVSSVMFEYDDDILTVTYSNQEGLQKKKNFTIENNLLKEK